MADISDVENALVTLIAQTLYPNGTSAASATGIRTAVYAGWPGSADLDSDLRALSKGLSSGLLHVTVYPSDMERVTTRYLRQWRVVNAPAPTLTVAVSGLIATIGGTVSTPQNVMLMVNGQPYVYAVQASDTLASIATALATLIPGAISAGAVVTIPATKRLDAGRVGAAGTSILELGRQERVFQIIIWADKPANRAATGALLDAALRDVIRLTMPDSTVATLRYRGTKENDMLQKAALYRRDLLYTVEYATTATESGTQVTQTQVNVNADVAGTGTAQPVATLFD